MSNRSSDTCIKLGIVGAGHIAREHLRAIGTIPTMTVVGITSRSIQKAKTLAEEFSISSVHGCIDDLVNKAEVDGLMVLVSAEEIFSVTENIIRYKLPFFVEKPPGLLPGQTEKLAGLAKDNLVPNMVGYNRRFYSIFHNGLDIIKKHGDLIAVNIEGHERFWTIGENVNEVVCNNWIFANSTHTIDLLRFFGGDPAEVKVVNKISDGRQVDQISAAVEFESGIIGNYTSYWNSPGGWSATLYGEGVTVQFQPLEKGKWIDRNFVAKEILPSKEDLVLKAGFYGQMQAFRKLFDDGALDWPSIDLSGAYKTMQLAEVLVTNN